MSVQAAALQSRNGIKAFNFDALHPEVDPSFRNLNVEFKKLANATESQYRALGNCAVEAVARDELRNNDPLAHVWQLLEAGCLNSTLHHKFKTEFITDMAERSPDAGFYKTFEYRVAGNDLLSDTGLELRSTLQNSLIATELDVTRDKCRAYGLEREKVQYAQLDTILQWYREGEESVCGFASLCPSPAEQSLSEAKANGFKPNRLMASVWMYERQDSGALKMHAFSLDHCTLDRLQKTLDACDVNHQVGTTTLQQLGQAITTSSVSPQQFKQVYEAVLLSEGIDHSSLIADDIVAESPRAFDAHLRYVQIIADALRRGVVTKELSAELTTLRKNADVLPICTDKRRYKKFNVADARNLMEFLTTRVFPEYIYAVPAENKSSGASVAGSVGSAASRTEGYDGACPSSSTQTTREGELSSLASVGLVNSSLGLYEQLKGKYITCPGEPGKNCGKKVVVEDKILRDGILQCKHCAHTISVCGDLAKANNYKTKLLAQQEKARFDNTKRIAESKARATQKRIERNHIVANPNKALSMKTR